ncbi:MULTISPECIES: 3'-5' exonuclease [unclassified Exiguobacterium]|uniref:3'-5' exonuclease n=1 Tax=unclassified Exiguobacterium TaxID=2644629 RepID=UPI001BE59EF1|nr:MULTISPECIES: 3'-5' exonuclease [unclassified Exiguobacterium]
MLTKKDNEVLAAFDIGAIPDYVETMKKSHFVVMDIETTGFHPDKGATIIEIGAVRVLNGKIQDRFQQFVDPQMKIPKKIVAHTGITDEMVKGQPTIGQVLIDLHTYIGDAVVVVHNEGFDWKRFLVPFFKRVGIHIQNDVICTLKLFRRGLPKQKEDGYKLGTLAKLFDVSLENAHRADEDAYATAEVFNKVYHYVIDPDTVEVREHIVKPVEHTPSEVKRVRYWEKQITKKKMMKRLYVSLRSGNDFGTVYFDVITRVWYNKDFPLPLDFKIVENDVLKFLSLPDIRALQEFKN